MKEHDPSYLRTFVLLVLSAVLLLVRASGRYLEPGAMGVVGACAIVLLGCSPWLERGVRALRKKPTAKDPAGSPYRSPTPPVASVSATSGRALSLGTDVVCLVLALATVVELRSPEPFRGYASVQIKRCFVAPCSDAR